MDIVVGWLARVSDTVVFLLLTGLVLGAPMVLIDWWRSRRQETVWQQIALTDAIDARFGSIAAPLVMRPLWGPRKIRFAVQPGEVEKAFMAAQEVISAAGRMNLGRYEIVLVPKPARARTTRKSGADRPVVRWSGDPKAA